MTLVRFAKPPRESRNRLDAHERRIALVRLGVAAASFVVVGRLFDLQVLARGFYEALASGQHGIYSELFPDRGEVYLTDPTSADGVFPAAVNDKLAQVYANPREIRDPEAAAKALAPVLELPEGDLLAKLSRKEDPYEPLKKKVPDAVVEAVRKLSLLGIGFVPEPVRVYPEKTSVAHLTGFLGLNEQGERVGRYGVEGYWNKELAGERGFLEAEKDPAGRLIGTSGRVMSPAKDGDEFILTVDRTVQYVVCDKLKKAVGQYGAEGGTVIVMQPETGAVLAMCNVPDYDPNDYAKVADASVFNNPAIYHPYEPGSVFKPITMSAAIDAGKVLPSTTYADEGSVVIGPFTIKNSDGAANGEQTMTQVLEKSLNTGTIFAVRRLGSPAFLKYVEDFGFGSLTGVELDTESPGDIASLRKRGEIWGATASFGQGLTVTPIQLVSAFSAIANGGKLMKPTVVREIRHPDGRIEKIEPKVVRQVINKRTASLVSGMLVNVVAHGHGKKAAVPGYYVAGKTGTAQVPKKDGQGYEKDVSIGTFAGFAPADHPAFVMLVKIDRPRDVQWAEASAAPLFGDIAKFLLDYLQIPPDLKR
ncbi:MAG: penicillin-binding protein 2 [Patescibacteria group bacterium]